MSLDRLKLELGELLEARKVAGTARDLTGYDGDPERFLRDVLHAVPWDKQVEILTALRDHRLVTVRSANAVGKDWVGAAIALYWVFACGGAVLLTAPTEKQVIGVQMRGEVRRHFQRGGLNDLGELYANELRVAGAEYAGMRALTATDAAGMAGFHAPRTLLVLTEANGIPQHALDALLGCATGPHDRVLAIGNPLAEAESWFRASHVGSSPWHKLHVSAFDIIEAAERGDPGALAAQAHGGASRAWVEEKRRLYGEGSAWYQAHVLGEFPSAEAHALTTRELLEAAAKRWEDRTLEGEARRGFVSVALDPARGGDACALAIAHGPVVRSIECWTSRDTTATAEKTVERVRALAERARDAVITVDCGGLGGPVKDSVAELASIYLPETAIEEFYGTGASTEPHRFANKRAEAYSHLGDLLRRHEVALPRDELLFEELLAHRWQANARGQQLMEDKNVIRDQLGGRSPDRADAVAMALLAVTGDTVGCGGDVVTF